MELAGFVAVEVLGPLLHVKASTAYDIVNTDRNSKLTRAIKQLEPPLQLSQTFILETASYPTGYPPTT